jgi:hypothetical protein
MPSILKILLDFLRKLRLPRVNRCPGLWASFVAFICRRFVLWRLWLKNMDTFRKARPAEPSFPCIGARGYSVLGSSAKIKEHVVAASTVPTSASLTNLHDRAPRQTTTATPSGAITPPAPATGGLTVGHAPSAYDAMHPGNGSSANLSIHSRASDRLSIFTSSRESLRFPVGQPSQLPRATHRQFGLGPRRSRSNVRPSRSPSPSDRLPPHHQPPRLQVDTTNIHSHVVRIDPATSTPVPPSATYMHELSPPIDNRRQRRQSSGSVAVDVENPSTESLALGPSSPPPVTDEPFAIESPSAHSSLVSVVVDIPEELLQVSPTASSEISDFYLPEGQYIGLINSDQVPRYTKGFKMQVNPIVLLFHPYFCWQTA